MQCLKRNESFAPPVLKDDSAFQKMIFDVAQKLGVLSNAYAQRDEAIRAACEYAGKAWGIEMGVTQVIAAGKFFLVTGCDMNAIPIEADGYKPHLYGRQILADGTVEYGARDLGKEWEIASCK